MGVHTDHIISACPVLAIEIAPTKRPAGCEGAEEEGELVL